MSLGMDIQHPGFLIDTPLSLGAADVHLWRVDLEAVANEEAQWSSILSPEEHDRAVRFHFQEHRQYFTATRAILRRVLASYLDCDARDLTFVFSSKNKPSLGGAHANNGLSFNISHSGHIAVLAFTRNRQVGVDVEQVRSDFDTNAIAARFFSTVEQEQLASLPAEQRHDAFFRCWTRKEAYIKATGEGLSLPLRQFDVCIAPGSQDALLATRPEPMEVRRWSLRDVSVRPGYAAALCISGTDWNLIDWSTKDQPV
jgi:4'-phosphopantetheinyl transferase